MLGEMRIGFLCSTAILILALFNITMCAPDESYGVVSKIIDGSTFNIVVEKADPRIFYNTERITLADIKSPDLNTSDGVAARDLTAAVLLNRRVFLDINNLGNGRDSQGRLVCVVYLSGYYGQPLLSPCYNRILVDSGLATVNDSKDNEFNPADWWSRASSTGPGYNDSTQAINRLESRSKGYPRPCPRRAGQRVRQKVEGGRGLAA